MQTGCFHKALKQVTFYWSKFNWSEGQIARLSVSPLSGTDIWKIYVTSFGWEKKKKEEEEGRLKIGFMFSLFTEDTKQVKWHDIVIDLKAKRDYHDHAPLHWLNSKKDIIPSTILCYLSLQTYSFQVFHQAGKIIRTQFFPMGQRRTRTTQGHCDTELEGCKTPRI